MGLLKEKYAKYDLPQRFMAMGVYPYFRCIESEQDTEVLMSGKRYLCSARTHIWALQTTLV